MFTKWLLTLGKQILGRFARGINSQTPPRPRRRRRQPEFDGVGSGIEHQAKPVPLVFMDQTGKLLFFWVKPVGEGPRAG